MRLTVVQTLPKQYHRLGLALHFVISRLTGFVTHTPNLRGLYFTVIMNVLPSHDSFALAPIISMVSCLL